MKRSLVIFAKEPGRDNVKTRLKGCLSKSQRTNLYKAFLKDTIEIAKRVGCENKIVAYDAGGRTPSYLKTIAAPFRFYEQKGKDLGERMHNAFKFALRKGRRRAVIIGSDSPTLPKKYIKNAFVRLNTADVVLGPSLDGGYYLIGLRKPCPALFKNIPWSSRTVFEDTLKKAKRYRKRVSILDYWYDVDDPNALASVRLDLGKGENKNIARWTKAFLNKRCN